MKMLPRSCRYRSNNLTWDLGEEMVWPRFLINFGVGEHNRMLEMEQKSCSRLNIKQCPQVGARALFIFKSYLDQRNWQILYHVRVLDDLFLIWFPL